MSVSTKKTIKNVKIVQDPLWGAIDITEFIHMIDIPEFQSLRFKYQLGVTQFLFPAATHSRFEHSLGSFKRTQDLTENWIKKGFIDSEEAKLLCGYALWHDIGHGPFSHVIEEVTHELWGRNHDQNGAIVVARLKEPIKSVGLDFEKFIEFFKHENPLYLAVHDKNLGSEKLDYLSRDSSKTIGETRNVEYLARHTYFIDGLLVVDEKAIDNAKELQEFYVKMYKTVYLRKNSAIAQRMVQKMILELIQREGLEQNELWAMTDFELLYLLTNSSSRIVKTQAKNLITRNFPKTAVAFKIDKYVEIERRKDKKQRIFGISEEEMIMLAHCEELSSPSNIQKVEENIASMTGLPSHSVLIVPPSSLKRFRPQDINIYSNNGTITKLSDYYPEHFDALGAEGKSYSVVRVCTFKKYREELSKKNATEKVKEYILSLIE